jgi:hypothetical protein
MMHATIQSWLEQAAGHNGVLACGARLADRTIAVKSCQPEIGEPQLVQAMRDVSDAVFALQQNRLSTEHLRWTFENVMIRCIARPGGVLGALVLTPACADLPEIEQLLADFALIPS